MYKIGITGSIGSGKTTIAKNFSIYNIPIFNADDEIKNILKNRIIVEKIKNKWPQVCTDNSINKLKLRSIIFSNEKEKKKLENILYPQLEINRKKFEKVNANKTITVYDVPLIYETKSEKNYNLILLANCKKHIQMERVLKRDKISKTLFEKILKTQMSFEKKKKFKPKIINTNNHNIFIFIKITFLLIWTIFKLKTKNEQ